MEARGTFADVMTFSKRNTGNICRYQRKQKDVITAARTIQRASFLDAKQIWGLMLDAEKELYVEEATKKKISPYNLFLQYYMGKPPNTWCLFSRFEGEEGSQEIQTQDNWKQTLYASGTCKITKTEKFGGQSCLYLPNKGAGLSELNSYSFGEKVTDNFILSFAFKIKTHCQSNWEHVLMLYNYTDENNYKYISLIRDGSGIYYFGIQSTPGVPAWLYGIPQDIDTWVYYDLVLADGDAHLWANGEYITSWLDLGPLAAMSSNMGIESDGEGYIDNLRLIEF